MASTSIGHATASTAGEPIEVGTSATTIHTPPTAEPDDVVVLFHNTTAADANITVLVGAGPALTLTVAAYGIVAYGPVAGTAVIKATALAGSTVYALLSARR